jgi:hypothetical protein
MADELDKDLTLDTISQALADLRFSVSEFQEIIEEYLTSVETLWREAKSHLASIEARLAGMEVQLSMIAADPGDQDWRPDGVAQMLTELNEVVRELGRMRQRFHSFTRGTLDRIN